ncbi:MAG: PilZ domain-containing protein [Planctomycetaceae bacterium]|nr:PilZ domain-containing protein [Planctomycetaceae bacterium]
MTAPNLQPGVDLLPSRPIDVDQWNDLVHSAAAGRPPAPAASPAAQVLRLPSAQADRFGDALRRLQSIVGPPWSTTEAEDVLNPGRETAAPAEFDASDRRSFPRREAHGHASVASFPHVVAPTRELADALLRDAGVSGELIDLSRNGLAIVLLQPLAAGEEIIVRLCYPGGAETRDVLATVVRSTSIDGGLWKIVARLLEPLSFDAAYDLFDRQPPLD